MKSKNKLFFIFSQARSGTNLLVTSLNQHPEVDCASEIFNPIFQKEAEKSNNRKFTTIEIFEYMWKYQQRGARGFVQHDIHFTPELFSKLTSLQPKVIRLTRKNQLERHVSLKIAQKTMIWATEKHPTNLPTIHIDMNEMIRDFNQINSHTEMLSPFRNIFNIHYEDLSQKLVPTVKTVFKYIDVTPIHVKPQLVKIEQRPLYEIIENFEEVKKALKSTKWEKYLEKSHLNPVIPLI